jgi:hypothetical protein
MHFLNLFTILFMAVLVASGFAAPLTHPLILARRRALALESGMAVKRNPVRILIVIPVIVILTPGISISQSGKPRADTKMYSKGAGPFPEGNSHQRRGPSSTYSKEISPHIFPRRRLKPKRSKSLVPVRSVIR